MLSVKKGNSSSNYKSFLACVDERVSGRESKAFWKGLTKLHMYKRLVNSRSTYMAYVMQGLDFCLSLDQARMV